MKKPKMPAVQDPVRMPVPDDAQAKAAKDRARQALQSRGGRESTDLTTNNSSITTLGN